MPRFDIYEQLTPTALSKTQDGETLYAANFKHHGFLDCRSAREAIQLSKKIIRFPVVQQRPVNWLQ